MQHSTFTRLVAAALVLNLLTAPLMQAQDAVPADPRPRSQVLDVTLSPQGSLDGRLLNKEGKAIDGAEVSLWQAEQRLASVVSDREGAFRIAGVKTGFYRLESPGQTVACRVWTAETAPPTAQKTALMVKGDPAVRGQYGVWAPGMLVSLALGVTAVTLAAVTLSDVNDLDKKVDRIIDELRSP